MIQIKNTAPFQVNTYTDNDQTSASVARLNNDSIIVTWQSQNQDGSGYGIYGQLFDTEGNPIGSEFQINTYTNNDQASPSVTLLNNGNFVVVWHSQNQDGSKKEYMDNFLTRMLILLVLNFKLILLFWTHNYHH